MSGHHTTKASLSIRLGESKMTMKSTSRSRVKTPSREGYEIYKAYKIKMQKMAEEEKLPAYM
jgi:hypothetical protein